MEDTSSTAGPVALTHQGRVRGDNQDSSVVWGPIEQAWDALLIIADGMGGHVGGKQASGVAADTLATSLARSRDQWGKAPEKVVAAVRRGFAEANASVRGLPPTAEGPRPGTTLTCAILRDGICLVAHVGDCRTFLITPDSVEQVTEDQTWVADQVRRGAMSPEEARRSPFRNQILQALGTQPEVSPAIYTRDLSPGDTVLLCTDGLSAYCEGEEIAEVVRHSPDVGAAANQLINRALERGGEDNVTVVAARATRGCARSVRAASSTSASPNAVTSPLPAFQVARGPRRSAVMRWLLLAVALCGLCLAAQGVKTALTPRREVPAGPAPVDRESVPPRPVGSIAAPEVGNALPDESEGRSGPTQNAAQAPSHRAETPRPGVEVRVRLVAEKRAMYLEVSDERLRLRGRTTSRNRILEKVSSTCARYVFRSQNDFTDLAEGRAELLVTDTNRAYEPEQHWRAGQDGLRLRAGDMYLLSLRIGARSVVLFALAAEPTTQQPRQTY